MLSRIFASAVLLCSTLLYAQKPEYDFYSEYRTFMSALWTKNPSITPAEVHEAYSAKLKNDGVPDPEIARRLKLLATESSKLEADRWDRFYLGPNTNKEYNHNPNAFLMAFVAERRPGVALDYAMGSGRNALTPGRCCLSLLSPPC